MLFHNPIQAPLGIGRTLGREIVFPRIETVLASLLFAFYVLVLVSTFRDYGITYDEDWQVTYGQSIVRWYSSGFHDHSALTYRNLSYYGGFFDVVLQLVANVSPLGLFETGHLLAALFGWLGVFGAYKLGKLLAGPYVGLLSALFLGLTPRFYGDTFGNFVDVPFATLSVFYLYYLIRLIRSLPHPPRPLVLKLAATVGLALGIRIGAILLLGYLALGLGLWLLTEYVGKPARTSSLASLRATLFGLVKTSAGICAIAYVVMLVWWPAAQVEPMKIPARALLYSGHFEYPFNVFFEGRTISSGSLPWYYQLKWFLITLPEFYFGALALGAVLTGKSWRSWFAGSSDRGRTRFIEVLLLVSAVLVPLAYATVAHPVNYDGVRHFLFVIPPLAILAAVSIVKTVERLGFAIFPTAAVLAIAGSLLLTVVDMVQLHPYQYVYFNRLIGGGLAQAARAYETDYWGSSYKEAAEWVSQRYTNQGEGEPIKVASCLYSLSTSYFLSQSHVEYLGSYHDGQHIAAATRPDVFLASPRWDCDKKLSGTVLHTVARQGAPLLYIIEVSPPASSTAPASVPSAARESSLSHE